MLTGSISQYSRGLSDGLCRRSNPGSGFGSAASATGEHRWNRRLRACLPACLLALAPAGPERASRLSVSAPSPKSAPDGNPHGVAHHHRWQSLAPVLQATSAANASQSASTPPAPNPQSTIGPRRSAPGDRRPAMGNPQTPSKSDDAGIDNARKRTRIFAFRMRP
jgi:hypothetical protein